MRERRKDIFVLIDALGWSVLQNHDFLPDVLPHRKPLRTVLGFSSGAIPTILTGVPPAGTGHWNLFYYDPNGSPFHWMKWFRFLPDAALNNRLVCKLLKETGRRVLGLGPLFECCVDPTLLPWFNWIEKKNIYDEHGITGAPSIFDYLAKNKVSYKAYSYHDASDAEILRRAEENLRDGEVDFLFLYLCELDMVLHNCFSQPTKLRERLEWYAAGLRRLITVAQQTAPGSTLTIFSDHGMTPVRKHFDLVSRIEALGFKMPKDYLGVYDSTMARFWFFSDGARNDFTELLRKLDCGHILSKAELQELGIYFPDCRYGELIFLLEPGCLFSRSNFNGKSWMPAGMHGYHPDDAYSDGVFLTSYKPSMNVNGVADVYSCMKAAADEQLV